MRNVIYYNPHVDDFLAEPPHYKLIGRRPLKKYGFVLDEEISWNGKVNVLVDGTISAFIPGRLFVMLPKPVRAWVAGLEYDLWVRKNRLERKVTRITDSVRADDAILIAFSYKNATTGFSLRESTLKGYKAVVFHLSHYFISTRQKAENLEKLSNVWLAGDSDITDHAYFRHFFPWYRRPFLVMPFSVSARFRATKSFGERQSRCVATGTFHDLAQERPRRLYADYQAATGLSTYHPLRKAVHEGSNKVRPWIEARTSPYRASKNPPRLKWWRHLRVAQKDYFAVDIVKLYNDFKCAAVGEERSGFPALGAFEAMACGCVLIADASCYNGLGLKAGVHFLAYDGTLDGLLAKIPEVVTSQKAVEIADVGREMVTRMFSAKAVYDRWQVELRRIENSWGDAQTSPAAYSGAG